MNEVKEALDRATAAIQRIPKTAPAGDPEDPTGRPAVREALIALHDVCSELAKRMGVPGAVEPDEPPTGG